MRLRLVAVLTAIIACASPASALDHGKAGGSLSAGPASVELKLAYATQYFNEEGLADAPELRILLADRKVDVDLLAGPTADAVERLARRGELRGVLLRLDPTQLTKAPVRGTLLMPPATPADPPVHFTVAGEAGGFDVLKVSKDRVQGEARFASAAAEGPAFSYRATFNAPVLRDRPTARLIGARAQESPPAKTLLAFERALLDGDLATVDAHATPERFAAVDADFRQLGAAVFLEQVRAELPPPAVRQRQVREVVIHGRRAWVVAVSDDGSRTVVPLVHVDGVWKVD